MYILYVCIYIHIYMYIYTVYICIYLGVHKSPPWRALMSLEIFLKKMIPKEEMPIWPLVNPQPPQENTYHPKSSENTSHLQIDFLPMSWQCFPMWKLWISELNPKCPKQNLDIRIISCMEFTKHFEPWQIWNLNRHPLQLAILEAGCLDSETGHPSIDKEGQ